MAPLVPDLGRHDVGGRGATLPGDDLLKEPDILATRAISIGVPADLVWPWLVQMGPGRAGAYTYDWIENVLGLNMHSADVIIPELQELSVGDTWWLGSRLGAARREPPAEACPGRPL